MKSWGGRRGACPLGQISRVSSSSRGGGTAPPGTRQPGTACGAPAQGPQQLLLLTLTPLSSCLTQPLLVLLFHHCSQLSLLNSLPLKYLGRFLFSQLEIINSCRERMGLTPYVKCCQHVIFQEKKVLKFVLHFSRGTVSFKKFRIPLFQVPLSRKSFHFSCHCFMPCLNSGL